MIISELYFKIGMFTGSLATLITWASYYTKSHWDMLLAFILYGLMFGFVILGILEEEITGGYAHAN